MSSKLTRSPSSPSKSLGSCFEIAGKIYDTYPNASFDQNQIANLLELSSSSGAFRCLISDLKQYGLLVKSSHDGEFEISPTVKDYSVADDNEQAVIRFELATTPKIFSLVLENQGNHLPDNEALANLMVAKFRFNKAKALKTAKAMRESLEWADAIDAKGNVLKPKSVISEETENDNEVKPTEQPQKENKFSNEFESKYDSNLLTADVPVGDGRVVHVAYPHDLTPLEAKKIGAVLAALTAFSDTEEDF